MTQIVELIEEVREFITSPRKQHLLLSQKADSNKLGSSLDNVGDTELAVEAYLSASPPKSDGEKYLVVFGILQVLIVQQDAVKHLAESLDISFTPDPTLKMIREDRNNSIGHPTKRGGGKGYKFNSIVRGSLGHTGFSLMTTYADKAPPTFSHIDIPKLISSQRDSLVCLLKEIINKLKVENMAHKKEFQQEKLADVFPDTLSYFCDKISEAISGSMPGSFGAGMVDIIQTHLLDFKEALDRRGLLDALDVIRYHYQWLDYPLAELKFFFLTPAGSKLNEKDAYIFRSFVLQHLNELRDIAKKIDADYSKEA